MGHIYIYWLYTYIFQLLSMLYIYIFQLLCVVCILSFIWTSSCIYRMLVVCQVYISCVSFMICLYNLECSGIYIYTYVLLTRMYMFIKYCCLPSSYIEKHVHIHIYIYIIIYNINSLPLAGRISPMMPLREMVAQGMLVKIELGSCSPIGTIYVKSLIRFILW